MHDDTAARAAAAQYIDKGWAVIALHGVREGACTCGRPNCKSAGKHPLAQAWGSAALSAADQLGAGANIGLLTGTPSGFWVLDIDPAHDGDKLMAALVAEHGGLPITHSVRTGSGGEHYYFAMPEDFTPTNSRGRLPIGIDVRGEGGQVVAPPSVSGVGAYSVTESGPVAPAPAWLLELIRPLPPVEREYVSSAYAQDATAPGVVGEDRLAAYVRTAMGVELARLSQAVPGNRNNVAFEVACVLIELINSPWSGLSAQWAWECYADAARAAGAAGDFDMEEAAGCWRSAARKVGMTGRAVPALPDGYGSMADWGLAGGVPPFSLNGAPPTGGVHPQAVDGGVGMGSLAALPGTPAHVPHLRDYLLRRSELSRLPRPVPLIQGVLNRNTDAWLIGASGSGKSFVALDWAAHVATGRRWNGRRVEQGLVLMVVAEGASGTQQRMDAWERVYEPVGDTLVVLPVAVQAALREGRVLKTSPQWRQLEEIAADLRPSLLVLDTQARMSLGISENDNTEMGHWIEAVASLRRAAAGSANLVVHHTGRDGGDARGASAIDGAQDIEWKVERIKPRSEMRGRLKLEKYKDGADGVVYPFALRTIELTWDADAQEMVSSLVVSFDPFDQPARALELEHRTEGTRVQAEILEVLREGALTTGATKAEILRLVNKARQERADRSGMAHQPVAERTLGYALDHDSRNGGGLLQKELVVQIGQRFADKDRYEEE